MPRGYLSDDRDQEEAVAIQGVRAIYDSGKALKCIIDDEEHWIPHSQITDDSEVYNAGENAIGKLVVTKWFAGKEGLVNE
jgi:hypothetical protein